MSFGHCRENVFSVFIKVREPLSLKIYIASVKTYDDFYVFLCFASMFAHMYALI